MVASRRIKLTVVLHLDRQHVTWLKRVATFADISLDTMITVMLAWGIERAIAEGTMKQPVR